ncbi:MAG: hypothetical protein GY949_20865 [Gammaproteobacteria bacterium]|nr:hypothetical protein [Gammaproteobacteria bacterium]
MKLRFLIVAIPFAAFVPAGFTGDQIVTVPFVEASALDEMRNIELKSEPENYDDSKADGFTELEVIARCSETRRRGIDVTFHWQVERAQVSAHRIDLSMFRSGFATGRYLTSGERPADEKRVHFDAALPGLYYYWRLLSKTPQGWVVSGNGRFDSPICPADGAPG